MSNGRKQASQTKVTTQNRNKKLILISCKIDVRMRGKEK
jgi:hypothetical protein